MRLSFWNWSFLFKWFIGIKDCIALETLGSVDIMYDYKLAARRKKGRTILKNISDARQENTFPLNTE